ncbi:poly [ADP-ribose] polymerase 2-like [Mugil cephalus]|uniref:poly [ADP-ribose] polymerase 2-like n=1 Tax=Mugil cephalus TaxID=48193 RepID=UPI001FB65F1E|nr:poly [ADP-ribose] polymerase 2-like [Mugil cephalus]
MKSASSTTPTFTPTYLHTTIYKMVQIKEEEQEAEERRATNRRRRQSKSHTKTEKMSQEETKSEEDVKTEDSECKEEPRKERVYRERDVLYDVMLNQTNIEASSNTNKFYRIQLLEVVGSNIYIVRTQSGRVGSKYKTEYVYEKSKLEEAKEFFKKKFREQTKNKWENREKFKKVDGKYDLVLIDHNTDEKPSELDEKIQTLLKLIFDPVAMEEKKEINPNKVPLGKLTSEQIDAGYEALKSIEECLKKDGTDDELKEPCCKFYTRIPHDFGKKTTPPIIKTEEELKEKKALLEELRDIGKHPLDRLYDSLQFDLQPLDSASDEYKRIEKYLQTTQDSTDFTMTVIDIFSVNKKGVTCHS